MAARTDLQHHFVFPTEIMWTTQRPDIVIWYVKLKKVFVIELIVLFEENFDWLHQCKLEKYEDLRAQCVRNGWITNVFPIEVRCRDFITNSTSEFLTYLGLSPSDKRKYLKKIQDKALTASAKIWQSHRVTPIQQSLVVSWVTAGVYWGSGNDASAPKQCLNPVIIWWRLCWKQCCCINISYCMIPIYIYIYIYIYVPLSLSIYIYIYIYLCVCVCVCVFYQSTLTVS